MSSNSAVLVTVGYAVLSSREEAEEPMKNRPLTADPVGK